MNHTIDVSYPADAAAQIKVNYSIEIADDVQTINCNIEGRQFPMWLQLRKFSVSSLKKQGFYIPLFSEINNSKNMDTSLFIDMVYAGIMKMERLKVYEASVKN